MGYPVNTRNLIDVTLRNKLTKGIENVNNKLKNNLSRINADMKNMSLKYGNLRNQLSVANEQQKKRTEEHIANTGNHTASGYALSKRFNNSSAYLSELNKLNTAQRTEQANLENKIREAHTDADTERNKLIYDSIESNLAHMLEDADRAETRRMNSAKIDNMQRDMKIRESADTREQENHDVDMLTRSDRNDAELNKTKSATQISLNKDKRESEMHEIDKAQSVEKHRSEIERINSQTELNKASAAAKTGEEARKSEEHDIRIKYLEPQLKKELENTSKAKSSGSSSGRSSSKSSSVSQASSKMTPSQLADNILKQTGTQRYDTNGNLYYVNNEYQAYILLMSWKKKFNLSDQVVNDTAIHLGIQSYL